MATIQLPFWGDLEFPSPKGGFEKEGVLFEGLRIKMDLNFMGRAPGPHPGPVQDYLDWHVEEYPEKALARLIDTSAPANTWRPQIRSLFHLKRIGLWPRDESEYFEFDYTIDENFTDYLIVVTLNAKGELQKITKES